MSGPPVGLLYRDAVVTRPQAAFADDLLDDLAAWARAPVGDEAVFLVRALLSAATLEGALADAAVPQAALAAQVSDAVAAGLIRPGPGGALSSELRGQLPRLRHPRPLRASRPEGFAYYGLSPRRYAEAAIRMMPGWGPVTVVGIRTAGVALSACASALLRAEGRVARRLTVRPTGHPFDRRLTWDERAHPLDTGALAGDILVVDEGPGLSGSSFLAVAEALLGAGIPGARIACFGTRPVDPGQLRAPRAADRWRRFRYGHWQADGHWLRPGERDLSCGRWRAQLGTAAAAWPAAERLKALSCDGRVLRKFEGLGRHGGAVHRRALALADAGWTPRPLAPPDADGFIPYAFVEGRALNLADGGPRLCAELGRYIAERARLFALDEGQGQAAFIEMLATNVSLVLGRPWRPADLPPLVRPILVDGRLQPHEWVRAAADGRLIKTDGTAHGDDHFFPGPTDAAWDLAGAIVEWQLDPGLAGILCASYQRVSGDDPAARLPTYLLAYAAFRACLSALCARGVDGREAAAWQALEQRYAGVVRQQVRHLG